MKKITIILIFIGLFQLSYAQTSTFTYDANGNQISRKRPAISYLVNVSGDTSIAQGTKVRLFATGGDSYLWSNGETTATIEVQPESSTTYHVKVHCICGALIFDTVKVTVQKTISTAATQLPELLFQVFPNPASSELRAKIDLPHTADLQLTLLRETGEQLWQRNIPNAASLQISEALDNYASGIYLLQLRYEGKTVVRRVTIVR